MNGTSTIYFVTGSEKSIRDAGTPQPGEIIFQHHEI